MVRKVDAVDPSTAQTKRGLGLEYVRKMECLEILCCFAATRCSILRYERAVLRVECIAAFSVAAAGGICTTHWLSP